MLQFLIWPLCVTVVLCFEAQQIHADRQRSMCLLKQWLLFCHQPPAVSNYFIANLKSILSLFQTTMHFLCLDSFFFWSLIAWNLIFNCVWSSLEGKMKHFTGEMSVQTPRHACLPACSCEELKAIRVHTRRQIPSFDSYTLCVCFGQTKCWQSRWPGRQHKGPT